MQLINAIGHKLQKERQNKSILTTRDSVWDAKAPVIRLAETLQDLYGKKATKHWGTFESDTISYPFQTILNGHLNKKIDFVEFTKNATGILKSKIDTENWATGGYIVFINYKQSGENFLLIVMLDDVIGSAIDGNNISVDDATHLDLSRLHVGGRVNISKWNSDDERYLSFIKGKGNEVSRYFRYFLGCTDYTTAKDSTLQLVNAARSYSKFKSFTSDQKIAFEHKVYQYCEERRHANLDIELSALSAVIEPENPNEFFEFANGEPHQVDTIITPDRTIYKRLQYITYNKGEFRISFPRTMLKEQIEYNDKAGTLVIKKIPEELKVQLKDEP